MTKTEIKFMKLCSSLDIKTKSKCIKHSNENGKIKMTNKINTVMDYLHDTFVFVFILSLFTFTEC